MIISHAHRFIFFAVPRTGTHALRAALQPHLAKGDWQQQALGEQRRIPIAQLAQSRHGHLSLRQVQASLPETIWRSYFKFAVVRHPCDRFVSACAFLNRRNPDHAGNELSFMKSAIGVERFQRRVLIRPQIELLADETGQPGMDFIGRYEQLQQSFDEVCRRIGIPATGLSRSNSSAHADFRDCYDAELLALVNDFYRRDFQQWDYPVADAGELAIE